MIDGPPSVVVPALIGVQFVFALGAVTYGIGATTLRQTLTPDHLLGRVNATAAVIGWGVAPLGALLGGLAATAFGLREALLVAAVGEGLGALWLLGGRASADTQRSLWSRDSPRLQAVDEFAHGLLVIRAHSATVEDRVSPRDGGDRPVPGGARARGSGRRR